MRSRLVVAVAGMVVLLVAAVAAGIALRTPEQPPALQALRADVEPSATISTGPSRASTPPATSPPVTLDTVTPTPKAAPTPAPVTAPPAATSTAVPTETTAPPPPPPAAAPVAAGGTTAGQATYYGAARPGGACMTLTIPDNRYTTAVGPAEFAGSAACGGYLEVTGARGTIIVKIDNLCPECAPGHLDLSDEAFAAIDDPGKGLVPITYRPVADPAVSGGLVLQVKDGSNPWWLGLHVDNAGNAIAAVDVATGDDPLQPMTRSEAGFFVRDSEPGPGPYTVRVTDVRGRTVTAAGITLTPGIPQPTGLRFY